MPPSKKNRSKTVTPRENALALLGLLAKAADPRVTARQLRQEGLCSDLSRTQLRQRARKFLRRAQRALSQRRSPKRRPMRPKLGARTRRRKTA